MTPEITSHTKPDPRRLIGLLRRLPDAFIVAIGVLVLAMFVLVFTAAVVYSLKDTPGLMPEVGIYFLTTVNGILAANLGALVGVSVAVVVWKQDEPPYGTLQIVSALLYAAIVLAAWLVWWKEDFTGEAKAIVSVIPEMCRNGLGILLGVFALALGVKQKRN